MKKIPLTQNKFAIVSDEDYEKVSQYKWCYDSHNHAAVRGVKVNGKTQIIFMHRFIMDTPKGMDTDHINGERLDNRRENLRICTHTQNLANAKKSKANKSGYKGVSWDTRTGKWTARIRLADKYAFLGYFADLLMAAKAYDSAALKHKGAYARINGV